MILFHYSNYHIYQHTALSRGKHIRTFHPYIRTTYHCVYIIRPYAPCIFTNRRCVNLTLWKRGERIIHWQMSIHFLSYFQHLTTSFTQHLVQSVNINIIFLTIPDSNKIIQCHFQLFYKIVHLFHWITLSIFYI